MLIALGSIPVMLFGKPIYILMQQRKAKKAVSDNMSVRINMQTDETEIRNNIKNGNKIEHVKNGDVSHSHTSSEHSYDEVFFFILKEFQI